MTNQPDLKSEPIAAPVRPASFVPIWRGPRVVLAVGLLSAFAIGAGATAFAQRRAVVVVALAPAPIASMRDWAQVAVTGDVAEIFGNKFIVQDASGRALVETGRAGESGALVAKSETVTVQGRFEHGFIHAISIQHGDGHTEIVAPPGPPRPRPVDRLEPR